VRLLLIRPADASRGDAFPLMLGERVRSKASRISRNREYAAGDSKLVRSDAKFVVWTN
jgi:hypothetical protein